MLKYSKNSILFVVLVSLVFISCRVQKTAVDTEEMKERKFYKQYSEKLGYTLSGNENRRLVKSIADWMGTPYKFGGCSKDGTDCSCFIKTLYQDVYFCEIPRSSADMFAKSTKVNQFEMKEGDLVFFSIGTPTVSHVGLYIGNSKFVHASTSKGVIINDLTEAYYLKYFIGAGRLN